MTKRTRAPARRAPKPARSRQVPAHRTYSPELLANGRYRYEKTPERVADIAVDFRIHPGSLRRLAYRLGWVRYNMGPRQLPPAARLSAEADALAADAPPTPDPAPPLAALARAGDRHPASGGVGTSAIDRLEREVMDELASVQAMRAQLKGLPRRPREAEATARTLSSLTDTLQKLHRMRCAPHSGSYDDDDMPIDLDAFRDELARRIEAFVASREGEEDADGSGGPALLDDVR